MRVNIKSRPRNIFLHILWDKATWKSSGSAKEAPQSQACVGLWKSVPWVVSICSYVSKVFRTIYPLVLEDERTPGVVPESDITRTWDYFLPSSCKGCPFLAQFQEHLTFRGSLCHVLHADLLQHQQYIKLKLCYLGSPKHRQKRLVKKVENIQRKVKFYYPNFGWQTKKKNLSLSSYSSLYYGLYLFGHGRFSKHH